MKHEAYSSPYPYETSVCMKEVSTLATLDRYPHLVLPDKHIWSQVQQVSLFGKHPPFDGIYIFSHNETLLSVTCPVGDAVASWLVHLSPDSSVGFEPWPGALCCEFGQDTLLSQCLSPPRCTNGCWRI